MKSRKMTPEERRETEHKIADTLDALARTKSEYLKRDMYKHLRRLQRKLRAG